MNTVASYTILEDIDLVIEFYRGETAIENMIDLKKSLFSEKLYHSRMEILMDLRDIDHRIKEAEILNYFKFAKENLDFIGERKVAFLTSEPKDVVVGVLFDLRQEKLPIITKVFSTVEAAVSWLSVEYKEFDRINDILYKFSNK